MHERYIRFINERYVIASPHTIKQMKDIIRILPADPDDITREWVILFFILQTQHFRAWHFYNYTKQFSVNYHDKTK